MNTFFVSAEEFGQNIHSQYGEDGVIAEVSRQLDIKICNAMEFGAWNGYHLSNTFALVSDIKKLVLIEGDIEKFKDLMQLLKSIHQLSLYVPLFSTRKKQC